MRRAANALLAVAVLVCYGLLAWLLVAAFKSDWRGGVFLLFLYAFAWLLVRTITQIWHHFFPEPEKKICIHCDNRGGPHGNDCPVGRFHNNK